MKETFKEGDFYSVEFVDHYVFDATKDRTDLQTLLNTPPVTITCSGMYLGQTEYYHIFAMEVHHYEDEFGQEEQAYNLFYVLKGTVVKIKKHKK